MEEITSGRQPAAAGNEGMENAGRYNPSRQKRIFLSPPHMCGNELSMVKKAFNGNYIAPLGPQVDRFEKEVAEKVGISYATALASGTAAMHLALRVLGIGRGDEVFCQSLTFIGGVSPVLYQGAMPVFIDSEKSSWNMDPDLLEEELHTRAGAGKKMPAAVISTDIYGQCADMDRILNVCGNYGIPMVSDSAEALGATYKGRSAGAGATAAIFSFNGNKIITTSGGGMLLSDDERIVQAARFLSQQARDPAPHYEHSAIGYNYRMSNIAAAIGLGQLEVLDERILQKRRIFNYYSGALDGLAGVEFMPEAPYGQSTRWLSVVLITPGESGLDRETVRKALEAENIESRPVWKPMHLQPAFKECRVCGGAVCEDFFQRGLCLPSGTAMTDADLDRVVSVIRKMSAAKAEKRRLKAGGAICH